MIAVNYSTIRNDLKNYCDKVVDNGEVVIVTRKGEKNVVIISLEQYNEMTRQINNTKYVSMIEKSFQELKDGNIVLKKIEDFV